MFKTVLILSLISLCSCSVYKSSQRKDFDSVVQDHANVSISSVPASTQTVCSKMESLPAWIEREFPSQQQELLLSDDNVEVWKTNADNGSVSIRLFRPLADGGVESCQHSFASDKEWQSKGEAVLNDWGLSLHD